MSLLGRKWILYQWSHSDNQQLGAFEQKLQFLSFFQMELGLITNASILRATSLLTNRMPFWNMASLKMWLSLLWNNIGSEYFLFWPAMKKMCFSVIRSFSWLPWLKFFCKGRRSYTCNCFQNFQCYFLRHFLARFGFFVRKQLNDQSFWTLLSISDLFKFIYILGR